MDEAKFPKISKSIDDLVKNMCKDLQDAKMKKKQRKGIDLRLRKTISKIRLPRKSLKP